MRIVAAVGLVISIALLDASTAWGYFRENDKSAYNVTQYVSIQYDAQYCDYSSGIGYYNYAYKMNRVSRRWYRQETNRRVPSANSIYAGNGVKCNRDHFQHRSEQNLRPCFGCDGYGTHWTPPYESYPGYPYIYNPDDPEKYPVWKLGTRLEATVKNSSGTTLGKICNKIQLYGVILCS